LPADVAAGLGHDTPVTPVNAERRKTKSARTPS